MIEDLLKSEGGAIIHPDGSMASLIDRPSVADILNLLRGPYINLIHDLPAHRRLLGQEKPLRNPPNLNYVGTQIRHVLKSARKGLLIHGPVILLVGADYTQFDDQG